MPVLDTSRPPTPNLLVAQWVLDDFNQLRALRAALHQALTGQPLPEGGVLDEVPERIAVVATELATNALAHARPPTVVQMRRTEDTFILDVADEEATSHPAFAEDRPSGEGGLGLRLVGDLAFKIGWYADGDVKHVWAQFPIPRA